MTHFAVIWSFGDFYASHKPDTAHVALVIVTGVFTMTGFAYFVMVCYDLPVRAFFRSKLEKNSSSRPPHRV